MCIYDIFNTCSYTKNLNYPIWLSSGQNGAELPAGEPVVDPSGGNHRMTTVPGNAWGACDSPRCFR